MALAFDLLMTDTTFVLEGVETVLVFCVADFLSLHHCHRLFVEFFQGTNIAPGLQC